MDNYEQKYKETLEMARKAYYSPEIPYVAKAWLLTMFPTIAENEDKDERMKKAIMHVLYENYTDAAVIEGVEIAEIVAWLEKQGQEPKKVSIWKHWKDGICGNGEGKQIFLIKMDNKYYLSSCLGLECDYIELSELDNLMLEKQGEKQSVWTDNDRTMAFTLIRDVDQMTYISNEGKNERLKWLNSLEDKFNNVE